MSPSPSTDFLLVIPGIMGSVLQKDGVDAWNLSLDAAFGFLSGGRDLHELALARDPVDEPLDDGVRATALLSGLQVVPGFWKVDGYGRVAGAIGDALGIPPERRIPFPYDWRRDNRVAARALQARAEQLLARDEEARLVLVGHSMGGLVARYYTEVLGGWRHVRALVTLGTPHRGSPNALDALSNGLSRKLGPVVLADLSETVRTFTSVWQLLPTYRCVEVGGRMARLSEAPAINHLDPGRVAAALAFHREIADAVERNLQDPEYRARFPLVKPVVGISQPTLQSARWREDGSVELLRRFEGEDLDGDGTVPRVSATPAELSDLRGEMFTAARHASIQNDEGVWTQIAGVVRGAALDLRKFRSAASLLTATLGLDLEDAYREGEPVRVRIQPSREPVELEAQVLDPAGQTVARTAVRRAAGWGYEAVLPRLAPGRYRLKVWGRNAFPAEDVFAVLGRERPPGQRAGPPPAEPLFSRRRSMARNDIPRAGAEPEKPRRLRSLTQAAGEPPAPAASPPPDGTAGAGALPAGAGADAEAERVVRSPVLASEPLVPLARCEVRLGLEVGEVATGTEGTVDLRPAARDWKKIPLAVVLSSDHIAFDGGGRGTIDLLRGARSEPAPFPGTVLATAAAAGRVEVKARLFLGSRPCGSARATLAVKQAAAPPEEAPIASEPAGAISAAAGLAAPGLTVLIERAGGGPGLFRWTLQPDPALAEGLRFPAGLDGTCDLESAPEPFVRGLYAVLEGRPRGQHTRLLRGTGQRLWNLAPRAFQEAYVALRKAAGERPLSIQIVTDEHVLPWELMLVPTGKEAWGWLGAEHPVARWSADLADRLRPTAPFRGGAVLAPGYEGSRLDPLPWAQKERAFLVKSGFTGVSPADRSGALALLDQGLPGKRVSVLHYAGHGEFGEETAAVSRILLEQGSEILSLEIEDPSVHLGERDGTLVFLNACRVGRTGVVLSGMGGWASAFASRGFCGFVGPLWSVEDEDAYGVTCAFHELALAKHLPVAEALRQIRAQHGEKSDTWLAYVFHGDVTAAL